MSSPPSPNHHGVLLPRVPTAPAQRRDRPATGPSKWAKASYDDDYNKTQKPADSQAKNGRIGSSATMAPPTHPNDTAHVPAPPSSSRSARLPHEITGGKFNRQHITTKLAQAGLEGPGTSLQAKLAHFDALREQAVADRNWRLAQIHLDDLRECSAQEGGKLLQSVKAPAAQSGPQREREDMMAQEMRTFSTLWEERLEQFEAQAATAMKAMKDSHQRQLDFETDILRNMLATQTPRYSKHVMRAREALHNLVTMKHYAEADIVQRQVDALERQENKKFADSVNEKHTLKTKRMQEAATKAENALELRTEIARNALLVQRKHDFFVLLQRNDIKRSEIAAAERRRQNGQVRMLQKKIDVASSGSSVQTMNALLTGALAAGGELDF